MRGEQRRVQVTGATEVAGATGGAGIASEEGAYHAAGLEPGGCLEATLSGSLGHGLDDAISHSLSRNTVTEQLTPAGQQIEHDSFAIVDREAGAHGYTPAQWPLVRRMIHATADFEFNGLTRFSAGAVEAGVAALLAGRPVVADVEMICVGVSRPRLAHFGVAMHEFISDTDVIAAAHAAQTTRAVQAMQKAKRLGLLEGAVVAIGNAPTALLEVIRLIREEGVRPALVIGMPVGFVAAAESKALLASLDQVPWVITGGRKGGSTLVVAALHALLALSEARQKAG